ncbi:MAG: protein O-GlcNAc transferase, partial [Pirellulaceae bacterium]
MGTKNKKKRGPRRSSTQRQPSAQKIDPLPPHSVLLAKAMEFHQQGKLPEARRSYETILHQDPVNVDALRLSGLVALQQGESSAGVRLLNEAVRLRPDSVVCWKELARAYRHVGRFDRAEEAARRVIELQPDDTEHK